MSNASQRPHPRTGYRKPDAKRATLALRLTDADKALLIAQAEAAGLSVSDYIAQIARNQEPHR